MKKLMTMLATGAFLLAGGVLFAQGTQAAANKAPAKKMAKVEKKASVHHWMSGDVTAFEAGKSITVKDKAGKEETLTIDAKSHVTKSVKQGAEVRAYWVEKDGQNIATKIESSKYHPTKMMKKSSKTEKKSS